MSTERTVVPLPTPAYPPLPDVLPPLPDAPPAPTAGDQLQPIPPIVNSLPGLRSLR